MVRRCLLTVTFFVHTFGTHLANEDDSAPFCLLQKTAKGSASPSSRVGANDRLGNALSTLQVDRSSGKELSAAGSESGLQKVQGKTFQHSIFKDVRPDYSAGIDFSYITSNTSPEATDVLNATSPWMINAVICTILLSLVGFTSAGFALGKGYWVPALVLGSYSILLPGLVSKDFSFNIAAVIPDVIPVVGGERFQITAPRKHKGPIRESTRSLVPLLWDTGSRSGAVLIFFFAFIVPLVKLILLWVGEHWRENAEVKKVRIARKCIIAVQIVSKWASPDMFAFALLYYLLRTLHKPPILESIQVLDIGFSCYNIFCVASVISTMSVTPPIILDDVSPTGHSPTQAVQEKISPKFALPVALSITSIWAFCFLQGILNPCLSMRLDTDTILKALDLPKSLKPVADLFGIEDLVNSHVSLWQAVGRLWEWFLGDWELNLFLATTMLGFFGIFLTVLNMVLLVAASVCISLGGGNARWRSCLGRINEATNFVKHLAMLDVCTTGVVVVSFAASIYREQGIIIELEYGIYYLLASEMFRYACIYFILAMADQPKAELAWGLRSDRTN